MRPDMLDVVGVYHNPIRWSTRFKRHTDWEQHMLDSGVRLTTVECQLGERPFELPDDPQINRVRVRSHTTVWIKENLMNIGVAHLTKVRPEWRYLMCSDADIYFRNKNWATEAVHALQHYYIIQPWGDAYDLGPNQEHIFAHRSFCRQWYYGKPVCPGGPKFWKSNGGPYDYPHSGYAWCYTRQAWEWLGGLFEVGAMGSGDHHMALSLVGKAEFSLPSKLNIPGGVTSTYADSVFVWQERATNHIRQNIGYVAGTIEHYWHGRKEDRRYMPRWQILTKHQYCPVRDLKRNSHGVFELTGNKPEMKHDLDMYFRQRNEDANTMY